MNSILKSRFIKVNVFLALTVCALAVVAFIRERQWRQPGMELRNQVASLSLAVGALRSGASGEPAATDGFRRLTGGSDQRAKRLGDELQKLDRGIAALADEGRVKRRCYLDLDAYCTAIDASKGTIGTRWEVAIEGLARLRRPAVLKALQWQDDLKPAERTRDYWQRHVARLPEGTLKERNPWGGVPGRLLVADRSGRGFLQAGGGVPGAGDGVVKAEPAIRRYPGFALPGIDVLEEELLPWLSYDARGSKVVRGNCVTVGGRQINRGYDALLTIDPVLQDLGRKLVEQAVARNDVSEAVLMAMDVNSGEILAAYGAGERRLPRPGDVPHIFGLYPWASTAKVDFGAALLEYRDQFAAGGSGAAAHLAGLPGALAKSDTAWFQKAALDYKGAPLFVRQAQRFGLNQARRSSLDFCFGSGMTDSPRDYPITGRIFVDWDREKNAFRELNPDSLYNLPSLAVVDKAIRSHTVQGGVPSPALSMGKLVRVQVAGQGDARTSLWGELLIVSHVATAANGGKVVPLPHLVRRIIDAGGRPVDSAPTPAGVPAALSTPNAQKLAGYLSQVNARGGTAAAEFQRVFGRPAAPGDRIFAKTGTTDSEHAVPYKLYIAGFARDAKSKGYDTALVAVVKRSRLQNGGFSPSNHAAEIGLEFIRQTRQL